MQNAPGESVATEASLMLGMQTIHDNLGILAPPSQFALSPGKIIHVPFYMVNLGEVSEQVEVNLHGLENSWFALSETQFTLAPGERKRLLVALHLPRQPESRAGRHAFSIAFVRQSRSDEPITIGCTLTVAAFVELKCEPERVEVNASETSSLQLTNLGNIPQTCQVTAAFRKSGY